MSAAIHVVRGLRPAIVTRRKASSNTEQARRRDAAKSVLGHGLLHHLPLHCALPVFLATLTERSDFERLLDPIPLGGTTAELPHNVTRQVCTAKVETAPLCDTTICGHR
jgi:hypothetical protein